MTALTADRTLPRLKPCALRNVPNLREALRPKSPSIQDLKTHNILLEPPLLPLGVYRRRPPLSILSTKTRLRLQRTNEAPYGDKRQEGDPHDDAMSAMVILPDPSQGFPHPLARTVRVLGVTLGKQLTLGDHFCSLLKRPQVWQGILARVGRETWGLDDLMKKVGTRIINIASRQITGLPLSVRVESLHFLSGAHFTAWPVRSLNTSQP